MAVNDNRNKIRFRRGVETNLVSPLNTEKIAYGQPIYNATKNYLTIGDSTGNKTYKNLAPIDVRRVRGYFSDDSQMSGLTPENKLYYMTGKDNNLELYSQGGFQLWTGSKAWTPSDPDAIKTFEVYRNQYAQFHVPMRSDIIRTQNIKTSTNDTDVITLSNNLITLNKDLSSAYDITTNKLNGVLTSDIFESDGKTVKTAVNLIQTVVNNLNTINKTGIYSALWNSTGLPITPDININMWLVTHTQISELLATQTAVPGSSLVWALPNIVTYYRVKQQTTWSDWQIISTSEVLWENSIGQKEVYIGAIPGLKAGDILEVHIVPKYRNVPGDAFQASSQVKRATVVLSRFEGSDILLVESMDESAAFVGGGDQGSQPFYIVDIDIMYYGASVIIGGTRYKYDISGSSVTSTKMEDDYYNITKIVLIRT